MTDRIMSSFLIAGAVLSASECFAEKNAKLKPTLITAGDTLLETDFSGKSLGDRWTANKGEWKAVNGAVVGREKAEDKHAAVLTCAVPNRNSAIRLSFKLGEAKAFHVSYNKTKGHLFRVIVDENSVIVRTDKPSKTSKVAPVTLGKATAKFQRDQWYTMLIEVDGGQVAVQTDNGVAIKGRHEALNVAKPNYRFILRGDGLQLDDITILQARP